MKTPHPLDGIYMSAFAREDAKAHMLRAEFIADLIVSAISKVRAAVTLAGQLKSRPNTQRAVAN